VSTPATERRIYHVGPWRRAVPWLIFGPFLLLAAGIGIAADDVESRALGRILVAVLLVLVLGMHLLISWARLELTTEGVRLRQIGMNLTTPWSNVLGLRLGRGRQGIVAREPITGRGAANLAAVRGFGYYGASLYDAEQQAAMAEQRWIPIEPFAWHLQHGRLHDDLKLFAPEIEELPDPPATAPQTPAQRRRTWFIFGGIMTLAVTGALVLGLGPPSWGEHAFPVLWAMLAPLLTLRAIVSTITAFRTGGRFMGVVFAAFSMLGVLWCLVAWSEVIVVFSGGD